jgi:hypothetical protein
LYIFGCDGYVLAAFSGLPIHIRPPYGYTDISRRNPRPITEADRTANKNTEEKNKETYSDPFIEDLFIVQQPFPDSLAHMIGAA